MNKNPDNAERQKLISRSTRQEDRKKSNKRRLCQNENREPHYIDNKNRLFCSACHRNMD